MRGLASLVPYNPIDEQAARWAARTAGGDPSAEMAAALESWLSEDRRHRGAYFRACAGLAAIDESTRNPPLAHNAAMPPASSNDNEDVGIATTEASPRRRFAFVIGGTLAASVALILGSMTSSPFGPQPGTQAAHRLNLADGSVATLAKNARIEFGLTDGTRKVMLLNGEAAFQVAKDAAHPFVVQSGDVFAQATGTIYSVRRVGESGAFVRVDEGSVLVWSRGQKDQAVLLRAGGTLTLGTARPAEMAQINLDDVNIADAAAQFNQVNHTQIVIADRAIGEVKIIGLFEADDPEQFAKSAALATGSKVEYIKNKIVIKMK